MTIDKCFAEAGGDEPHTLSNLEEKELDMHTLILTTCSDHICSGSSSAGLSSSLSCTTSPFQPYARVLVGRGEDGWVSHMPVPAILRIFNVVS